MILILNSVVSVDCNSFASIRLLLCSVQSYFGNTRLMKIENAMSVISVAVSVLYVHELYLFCCIFCFLHNRSLFPCIMLTGLLCVFTCISLLLNKISIFISKKKKKNFVNTTVCNLLASFGFVELLVHS